MKRVLFWVTFLFAGFNLIAETPIKVMTFNIRMNTKVDGLNSWPYRRDEAANMIKHYAPDIIGTQEVLHKQLKDLKSRLPKYKVVGVGREDGKKKGEYSALWYNADRFDVLDSGTFWLSETPEVAGSKGWDGACERVATWAKLRDRKSKDVFIALNTHLDHVGKKARSEGVKLILDRLSVLGAGIPIVVTGDFNATSDTDVIARVTNIADPKHLSDSRAMAKVKNGDDWSFHDYGKIPVNERPLIDYIFVANDIDVKSSSVLPSKHNGRFVSDHSPVMAEMVLNP